MAIETEATLEDLVDINGIGTCYGGMIHYCTM